MSGLALVTIILGVFVVISRGPFIFAPEATRKAVISHFLVSTARLRIVGLPVVAMGVLIIIAAQGRDQTAALVIKYYGWFIAIAAGLFHVILAPRTREFAKNILERWSITTLRIRGFVGVIVGALLICLGFAVH